MDFLTKNNSEILSLSQNRKTPFFLYDMGLLKATIDVVQKESNKHGIKVHYAVKANSNNPILELIKSVGFGADCVSGNEVKRALEVGFSSDSVVFAGVGKSDWEIEYALENNIGMINCESYQELLVINEIAAVKRKKIKVAIRINPNVDAKTHANITTGISENKFGFTSIELNKLLSETAHFEHIEIMGLHFHIGSQITSMDVFERLTEKAKIYFEQVKNAGYAITSLNLGGGLGIDYQNPEDHLISDFKQYFEILGALKKELNVDMHVELGRSIVGQCGLLISRALYVKQAEKKCFVVLDAGMTELIRPALYNGKHKIDNITSKGAEKMYDVVGPICETTDSFGEKILLNETKRNDLFCIKSSGAYGEVMKSAYNLRELEATLYHY